jgi:type III secretion protein L
MLCLKNTGLDLFVQGPVLKAADFAAILASRDLIAKAEAEAARIRAEATAHFLAEKERGYQEGREQGKAEMAQQVIATLGQSTVYFSKVEKTLIDVVMQALRRIIGEFEERERVERIVHEALELLRNNSQVRLKVSPTQEEWMKTRVEALLSSFPRIQFLDVGTDTRLPPDGCILETEFGVIDATVETQLRAIEKALVQALR